MIIKKYPTKCINIHFDISFCVVHIFTDCKYGQMVFEDCDATTNRRRITRTLNAGASTGTDCEQTVVVKDNVRCTRK